MSITLPLTTTLPSLHRKKLSNFCHHSSWHRDSNNYVAKSYMVPVDRRTYFDDVKLQMEAKLWSEEYNRHNPPKKVRRDGGGRRGRSVVVVGTNSLHYLFVVHFLVKYFTLVVD